MKNCGTMPLKRERARLAPAASKRLGHEANYGTTLGKYFMAAFELPLLAVPPIGGWAPDSTGEISDARIQEPTILKSCTSNRSVPVLGQPISSTCQPMRPPRPWRLNFAQASSPMSNYPKRTLNDPLSFLNPSPYPLTPDP